MANDNITGNEVTSSDFLKVLLALKDRTLKDCHVLELGIVKEINDDKVICNLLSNPSIKVQAIRINQMSLLIDQLVLIGFNDNDFKSNLNKYKVNDSLQENDSKERHLLTNGIIITNFETGSDGSNKANVDASNLNENNVSSWRIKLSIPSPLSSIDGLAGGTLTSPLKIKGGNSLTASKISLDQSQSGQITDNSASTLFGFLSNNTTTLTVGDNSYVLNLRGSATRPTYKGNDLALYSDIAPSDVNATPNTLVMRDGNGDINARYVSGTRLRTTATTNLSPSSADQGIAVLNNGWIYYRPFNDFKNDLASITFDDIYPVGSIYMSTKSQSPAAAGLSSGTWVQLKDTFLLAHGDTYTSSASDNPTQVNAEGGEATHTLTINEMPKHTHSYRVGWGSGGYDEVFRGGAPAATGVTNESVIGPTGGGKEHNNMPPYLVVYMWKRTA